MLLRFVLALALALGFFTIALAVPSLPGSSAATCIMVPERDPWKRLEGNLEYAELVVIGTVVAETHTGREGYRSTVRIESVLKGEMPGPEIELPRLYDDWACVGGPRLHEGITVLLLLFEEPRWLVRGEAHDLYWTMGPAGGNVVFEGGDAVLDDFQAHRGKNLGHSEEVVRKVGSRLNASEETIDRALAAIGIAGAPQERDGGISRLTLLAIGAAALAALIALTLAARRFRLKN